MNLDFESQFNQAIKEIKRTGKIYAQKKRDSWLRQGLTSSVLASVIKSLPGGLSDKKSEYAAKNSQEYRDHLEKTADGIKEEIESKVEYESANFEFEKLRSLCSLEKKILKEIE